LFVATLRNTPQHQTKTILPRLITDNLKRSLSRVSNWFVLRKGRKPILVLIIFAAAILGLTPGPLGVVRAALVGKVCIADVSLNFCPPTPTIVSGTKGTPLDVAVNIQGSDTMNGFDIFVKSDTTLVKPISVDLTGTVLGTNTIIFAQCIEIIGSGCGTLLNGPGIVRFAVAELGAVVAAPATGRLFSIRYDVLQNSTGISIGYQTGCSQSSVPQGLCVEIVNAGVPVSETAQESATPGVGDFTLSGDQTITLPRGTEAQGFVNVVSQGGFFGGVSFSISIDPIKKNNPVASLSTGVIFILPGTSATAQLFVSTVLRTHAGTYTITVTGTSGSKSHTLIVTLVVQH